MGAASLSLGIFATARLVSQHSALVWGVQSWGGVGELQGGDECSNMIVEGARVKKDIQLILVLE